MELQLADEESEGLKAFDLYLSIIKPKGNE